jgi:hypothetical protein
MSYNTPELLLVGSASSLVLENASASFHPDCRRDNPTGSGSDLPELW